MLDIITLVDGKVLLISATLLVLYANRSAFDTGREGRVVDRHDSTPHFLHCDRPALF
jgi:hypothetical protein